jgi:hypothetical protein
MEKVEHWFCRNLLDFLRLSRAANKMKEDEAMAREEEHAYENADHPNGHKNVRSLGEIVKNEAADGCKPDPKSCEKRD